MDRRIAFGRAGEEVAGSLYRRLGFDIVARNFRSKSGEIDLVARRGRLLVFCEVKARRTSVYGEPSEAVTFAKRARLRRLAAEWMAQHRPGAVEVRFDVVSVIFRGAEPEVSHIPAAF